MNAEIPRADNGRHPTSPAWRIDAACDHFEAAWRTGRMPRIEDYLDRADQVDHPALIRELLALELELRLGNNERFTPDEYHRRFPAHADCVDAAFTQAAARWQGSRRGPGGSAMDSSPAEVSGASRMIVTLAVTEGPHRGQVFSFREHDTFIVGRSKDAHFRLPLKDKSLSRFHFIVEANPPFCRLIDMASRNGTRVNGLKVSVIDLRDGDTIRGGQTTLTVSIQPDPDRAESSPGVSAMPQDVLRSPSAGSASTVDIPTPVLTPESSPARSPATAFGWSVRGYQLERKLGEGGMGIVYRARRESDGRIVALKTIAPATAGTTGTIARFLREAGVLRKLEHPNIVRFEHIGHAEGRLFFAMEYVPGINADGLLKRRGGPLSVRAAAGLAYQALGAVAYAHDLGFVHRDIKPRNLLVAREGERLVVKLTDFGLARIYLTSPLSGLTFTGHTAGTSGFMAPEQITDFRGVKPAADQYSAAAMLYYLLTGKKIYDFPPEIQRQLMMVLQDEPVPIRDRRPGVPAELAAIIHRALARSPEDRFPDVRAMRDALRPFAAPKIA
jgi:serine/threonine-protein kinase